MSSPNTQPFHLLRELLLQQLIDDADQGRQLGNDPSVFLEMVRNYGAVEACSRVIMDPTLSHGFLDLWKLHRLDLTVEALVLRDKFRCLFADYIVIRARKRLADYRQSSISKAIQ